MSIQMEPVSFKVFCFRDAEEHLILPGLLENEIPVPIHLVRWMAIDYKS